MSHSPDAQAMRPPDVVIEIVQKLTDAGFETWCVGGAVRDALLGIRNQDWDVATDADPERVRKIFRNVIPLGIKFGTVGVVDKHGVMHEVTTFRRDVTHDGRHAVVEFGASFLEDLKRRDFTINAIAYDVIENRLYDPFDGRKDLAAELVRAVGVPIERFIEDRLRVLRGIRFAARFGFRIEPLTWNAMVESGPHLGRLSAERVKQELDKTLEQAVRPSEAFLLWQKTGAFKSVLPALANTEKNTLKAVDKHTRPRSAMTAARRQLRRQMRMITLFSDCSPKETATALKALRSPNAESAFACSIIERWHQLGSKVVHATVSGATISDGVLRTWAAEIGRTRVRAFSRLVWSRTGDAGQISLRQLYRRLLKIALTDPIEVADLAIDGDDLRMIGIPVGKAYGPIFAKLLAIVVEDPAQNTRANLLKVGEQIYRGMQDRS
ncbi:MAG: CCA tRNA nucleotidyltransferase [Gemmatimonadaceae bacterium]